MESFIDCCRDLLESYIDQVVTRPEAAADYEWEPLFICVHIMVKAVLFCRWLSEWKPKIQQKYLVINIKDRD